LHNSDAGPELNRPSRFELYHRQFRWAPVAERRCRAPAWKGSVRVCEKCNELDVRAVRYRELAKAVTDKGALSAIERLLVELEARKVTLHPDPDRS
jgi:hypothetical protein